MEYMGFVFDDGLEEGAFLQKVKSLLIVRGAKVTNSIDDIFAFGSISSLFYVVFVGAYAKLSHSFQIHISKEGINVFFGSEAYFHRIVES